MFSFLFNSGESRAAPGLSLLQGWTHDVPSHRLTTDTRLPFCANYITIAIAGLAAAAAAVAAAATSSIAKIIAAPDTLADISL